MSVRARVWLCLAVLGAWVGSALPGENQPPPPSPGQVHDAIWELRRAAAKPLPAGRGDSDVQAAIRRLQALELRPGDGAAGESASRPASQPASAAASQPAAERTREQIGPLPPYVLQQIRQLPPKELVNPVALADALFLGGHAEAACGFYELALKSEEDSESKAWLLYQMANCRRTYDPPGARQTYERLVAEHPGCPWQPLAKFQGLLIEWYEVNNPEALLARTNADSPRK